jgi:TolA-binding protein
MAETKGSRTLEMRVAELEDKLSQMHISEEEMETYQRVAQKLGAAPCQQCATSPCVAAQQQAAQQPCVAAQQAQQPCIANQQQASIYPYYYRCYYYPIYRPIYYADCILGPMSGGGPAGGGGGFGNFGM